jgi:phospholipid/cholesterol/gamma-HCH transport system ATP-binding protein
MVLLSNSDIARARMFCSELARELEANKVLQIDGQSRSCMSVSAGFAEAENESTLEQLISKAASAENMFYEFRVC